MLLKSVLHAGLAKIGVMLVGVATAGALVAGGASALGGSAHSVQTGHTPPRAAQVVVPSPSAPAVKVPGPVHPVFIQVNPLTVYVSIPKPKQIHRGSDDPLLFVNVWSTPDNQGKYEKKIATYGKLFCDKFPNDCTIQ